MSDTQIPPNVDVDNVADSQNAASRIDSPLDVSDIPLTTASVPGHIIAKNTLADPQTQLATHSTIVSIHKSMSDISVTPITNLSSNAQTNVTDIPAYGSDMAGSHAPELSHIIAAKNILAEFQTHLTTHSTVVSIPQVMSDSLVTDPNAAENASISVPLMTQHTDILIPTSSAKPAINMTDISAYGSDMDMSDNLVSNPIATETASISIPLMPQLTNILIPTSSAKPPMNMEFVSVDDAYSSIS